MEKLTGVSEITAVINDQHAKYQDLKGRLGILSRLNHRLERREEDRTTTGPYKHQKEIMKKLMIVSQWARQHVWAARIALAAGTILLAAVAFYAGLLLQQLNINTGPWMLATGFTALAAGIILYPYRGQKGDRFTRIQYYVRQKSCDALLVASTFLMLLHQGNFYAKTGQWYFRDMTSLNAYGSLPADTVTRSHLTVREFSASLKNEKGELKSWKERKKLLRHQLTAIRNDKEMSEGSKAILAILCVLIGLGLIALIAGLSCELSCNGNDAGAVVLLTGGTAAVVILCLFAIRKLIPKGSKEKQKYTEPQDSGN